MAMQQPRKILKGFKYRNSSIGIDRRREMQRAPMDYRAHFPKPVTYRDIDQAFSDWVNKDCSISYDGKEFPTYKLYSTQRISEYGQTWKNLDEKGNLVINFKTISRENNPQKGDIVGSIFNVPGHRKYTIFRVPVLRENGEEAVDVYSMELPIPTKMMFSVNVVTNKYEILNEFNYIMLEHFSGLECYIFPNGHAMPMFLESVGDESEYAIDDRKYYSQKYKIRLEGYIVKEDAYHVDHISSRVSVRFTSGVEKGSGWKGKKSISVHNSEKTSVDGFNDDEYRLSYSGNCSEGLIERTPLDVEERSFNKVGEENSQKKTSVTMEDLEGWFICWEGTDDEVNTNKKTNIIIEFNECDVKTEFEVGEELILEGISLTNVEDYSFKINGEDINLDENEFRMLPGDIVTCEVYKKDQKKEAVVILSTYDPKNIVEVGSDEDTTDSIEISGGESE